MWTVKEVFTDLHSANGDKVGCRRAWQVLDEENQIVNTFSSELAARKYKSNWETKLSIRA